MSETVTLLLFLISTALIAAGCHAVIKRYFVASLVAATAMVAGIQVASYIELGHVDPFWHIVSATGFFMAGTVALIVGIPFRVRRDVKHEDI